MTREEMRAALIQRFAVEIDQQDGLEAKRMFMDAIMRLRGVDLEAMSSSWQMIAEQDQEIVK